MGMANGCIIACAPTHADISDDDVAETRVQSGRVRTSSAGVMAGMLLSDCACTMRPSASSPSVLFVGVGQTGIMQLDWELLLSKTLD